MYMKYYLRKIVTCYESNGWIILGYANLEESSVNIPSTPENIGVIDHLIQNGAVMEEIEANPLLLNLHHLNLLTIEKPESDHSTINRNSLFLEYLSSLGEEESNRNELDHVLKDSNILILGCGAGASMQCYQLAQFGFQRITIVDFDEVAMSDVLRVPVWRKSDVGQKKVFALANIVKENFDIEINCLDKACDAGLLEQLLQESKYSLILKGMDPNKGFSLELDMLAGKYGVPHFSMSYAYHLVKIGPLIIPGQTISNLQIETHYREKAAAQGSDYYPSFNFQRLFPHYFIHPSVNFNIMLLAGLAFKEILFFLIGKMEFVNTLQKVIIYGPLTDEVISSDYAFLQRL